MCLPAEPIGVVMQSLVLYSGLNLFFAAAILLAEQSLPLLKYSNQQKEPIFTLENKYNCCVSVSTRQTLGLASFWTYYEMVSHHWMLIVPVFDFYNS